MRVIVGDAWSRCVDSVVMERLARLLGSAGAVKHTLGRWLGDTGSVTTTHGDRLQISATSSALLSTAAVGFPTSFHAATFTSSAPGVVRCLASFQVVFDFLVL